MEKYCKNCIKRRKRQLSWAKGAFCFWKEKYVPRKGSCEKFEPKTK